MYLKSDFFQKNLRKQRNKKRQIARSRNFQARMLKIVTNELVNIHKKQ